MSGPEFKTDTRRDVLAWAAWNGRIDVVNNGRGDNTCISCGEKWRDREVYSWWPIRLRWGVVSSSKWWSRHWIETSGHDPHARLGHKSYATVYHFGRLKLIFGGRHA